MNKNKIKILSIFGTRPEAIKFAPVIKLLEKDSRIVSKICVSGQHKEMLKQVLDLFSICPDYNLKVMAKNQSSASVVARVLNQLTPILRKEKPDMILVQGDTNTSLAGALAGYYLQISVGHIEAGLRTGDLYQPFPEEGNRVLISHLASLNFAPTKLNQKNLIKEGVPVDKIVITGNTVIDTLFLTLKKCSTRKIRYWKKHLQSAYNAAISDKRFVLVTGHRRENFGKGFEQITSAIRKIALAHPEINIIYPVHLNPNVNKPVKKRLGKVPNIYLISPVDYEAFAYLMHYSYIILTDSGGIQEEAPSLGKPVLVMREKTERPEAVALGTVKLVGVDSNRIVCSASRLLSDAKYYQRMSRAHNPYGDGYASEKILSAIKNYFDKRI